MLQVDDSGLEEGNATSPLSQRTSTMDAMVIVDMQNGLLAGPPKHDLEGVIVRINHLASMVRARSGSIIWIRHCGADEFAPGKPGWEFLAGLDHKRDDIVVEKTLNDAFAGTSLQSTLERIAPRRLLIAGWATDFCVDSTVRASVSHGYPVLVVSDAHTLADRPHLDAAAVIRHHNWVWSELIAPRSIRVATAAELLAEEP
jgi:nicotinamidase-related amidase